MNFLNILILFLIFGYYVPHKNKELNFEVSLLLWSNSFSKIYSTFFAQAVLPVHDIPDIYNEF